VQEASDRERSTNEIVRFDGRLRALDKLLRALFSVSDFKISRNSGGVTGPLKASKCSFAKSERSNEIQR